MCLEVSCANATLCPAAGRQVSKGVGMGDCRGVPPARPAMCSSRGWMQLNCCTSVPCGHGNAPLLLHARRWRCKCWTFAPTAVRTTSTCRPKRTSKQPLSKQAAVLGLQLLLTLTCHRAQPCRPLSSAHLLLVLASIPMPLRMLPMQGDLGRPRHPAALLPCDVASGGVWQPD